jgi:hypothetical protein
MNKVINKIKYLIHFNHQIQVILRIFTIITKLSYHLKDTILMKYATISWRQP